MKPVPEQERERFVTPEELPRLFDAIDTAPDARIADFHRLARYTSQRQAALLRMKFADLDLARAVWTDTRSGLYSTASCRFRRRHPAAASVFLAAPLAYPSLPSSRLSRSPMSLGTQKTNSFPFFFSPKTPRFVRSMRSVRAVSYTTPCMCQRSLIVYRRPGDFTGSMIRADWRWLNKTERADR